MHPHGLVGKPDFFFAAQRLAVFVDGCFWHGCPRCGHVPKTNSSFWALKIGRNVARDKAVVVALRKTGIKAVRVWEHELHDSVLQKTLARLNCSPVT